MAYRAIDVANAFISARVPGLTPMKLQKLIYFSHGWCLALTGKPFIDASFEAWPYGPVIPEIYQAFKSYRGNPVTELSPFGAVGLPEEANPLIRKIIRRYGHLSGLTLSDITHKQNSPWEQTRNGNSGCVIEDSLIRLDFKALLYDDL